MTVDEPENAEAATSQVGTGEAGTGEAGTGEAGTGQAGAAVDSPAETHGTGTATSATSATAAGATKPARPGEHGTRGADTTRAGWSGGPSIGSGGGGWARPELSRSRRLLATALTALGIAIGAAVLVGLLIAFLTRDVGSSSTKSAPGTPSLTLPAGDAPSQTAGAVPADWTEQTTGSGLVFRAPPGWTRRTDAVVDYRVDPAGPAQVGVGLSSAGDPDAAVSSYAQNNYSAQTAFAAQPAVDVTGSKGERGRQITLTYTRQGTPVTVVLRALPTGRGTVVVATRAPTDEPGRAAQLADSTDASLRRP